MEYQDRQITCADCAQPFVFSAGEQEFYARKGFKEEPKRCKPCRDARKARREGGGGTPTFTTRGNGNGRYGNGALAGGIAAGFATGSSGDDLDDDIGNRIDAPVRGPREVRDVRGGGARSGAPREMFDTVCASCGAPARVPFRPVAGRPVLCRDCYSSQANGG